MAKNTMSWPVVLLICVLSVGGVAMAPQGATVSSEREADYWAEVTGSTQHGNASGTTETTHATEITIHTTEPVHNTTQPPKHDTTEDTNATTEVPAHSSTENDNHTTEHPTTSNLTTHDHNVTSTDGPTTQPHYHSTETTTPATTTTEKPSSRKFDVASFFGGMAAAVGICVIIFLIVRCYSLRKKTRYNAM